MLVIKYDPINGKVVSDGLIKDWADNILKKYTKLKSIKIVKEKTVIMNITVGLSVMIDATRVLIMKGKLNYKEVFYQFRGLNLRVDKNGRLPVWPEGFCDVYDDILEELIEIKE